MTPYLPPLDDIRFVFERLVGGAELSELPDFAHADAETMSHLLEEFGRLCAEQLAPLNRRGDIEPCAFDPATGAVRTPGGWREAYAKYVEAGWCTVTCDPDHGGGGFPLLLGTAMTEILTSANMSFSLAPVLTLGAVELLGACATTEVQELFLGDLVAGRSTGTMNLTEPQAGSDVGALTARAVPSPDGDGTWRVSGTKIFISYGEHDLAGNIVHLVLARVPGGPPGTRGISCFAVPKVLPDGSPNGVRCVGIEHKMGLHGSPTCTLEYDDATGWLIGTEPHGGMVQMFTMMNRVRLAVGVSGLAIAERAVQAASEHARERVQGRPPETPAGTSAPIIDHPDVRRMLLHVRSHVDAMRALVYTNAAAIDTSCHGVTEEARAASRERADLLTPITKAWCTDLGSVLARICAQVHGGSGYIAEMGVEQFERDIRIASIYEGTNGIQAIDLVTRKIPMRDGAVVRELLAEIDQTAAAAGGPIGSELHAASAALREATEWLLVKGGGDARSVLAGATPYLEMFGIVLGGWFLARQSIVASPDDRRRQATARYYCEQVLPAAAALFPAVTAGSDVLFSVPSTEL